MMTPEERSELVLEISAAIACAQKPQLTEEELQWVRLAIKREAQSIALRQAVIEKTLSGLVWFALCAIGYVLVDWAKAHGFKP